jgi:hypothetical protein
MACPQGRAEGDGVAFGPGEEACEKGNAEGLHRPASSRNSYRDLSTPIFFASLDHVAAQRKLAAILSRLGSPFDGEKLAAARLATELIGRLGVQWHDIINIRLLEQTRPSPPPEAPCWRAMLKTCARHFESLSASEQNFIANLAGYTHRPTARQIEWLTSIFEKLGGGDGC